MSREREVEISVEKSLTDLLGGGSLHADPAKLREFLLALAQWIDLRADHIAHPERYD